MSPDATESRPPCFIHPAAVATFTCSRCGTFSCDACQSAPDPALCARCAARAPLVLSPTGIWQESGLILLRLPRFVFLYASAAAWAEFASSRIATRLIPRGDSLSSELGADFLRGFLVSAPLDAVPSAFLEALLDLTVAAVVFNGRVPSLGVTLRWVAPRLFPVFAAHFLLEELVQAGMLLCVVPGFLLTLLFWLVVPAIVFGGSMTAVRRAVQFSRTHWWKTVAIVAPFAAAGIGVGIWSSWSGVRDAPSTASVAGHALALVAEGGINAWLDAMAVLVYLKLDPASARRLVGTFR